MVRGLPPEARKDPPKGGGQPPISFSTRDDRDRNRGFGNAHTLFRPMPKNVVLRAVALTVVLFALGGVGGASGRTQIGQTTIQVQVIGGGLVSGGGQIACGNGSHNCFGTFVTGTDVELTGTDQSGWTYSAWTGDCTG